MHDFEMIIDSLKARANKEDAIAMKRYMKDHFDFFGVRAPAVREVFKNYISVHPVPANELEVIVKQLWELSEREFQMVAIHILNHYKKLIKEDHINIIEYCLTHKSWWDSVDSIASNTLGHYMKSYPYKVQEIKEKWMLSDNMWLWRSILLFQLKYKNETDVDILFNSIIQLKDSKEFFIQKAVGWALREYSKTAPEQVIQFVETHQLANLSKREALKWLKAKGKY